MVIVGGGIVGISTALHAFKRGWEVAIFDPRDVAGGASFGNAGIIAVSECVPIGNPSTLRAVPRMLLSRGGPLTIRPSYFPRLLPWLVRMLATSSPAQVKTNSKALSDILQRSLEAHLTLASDAGIQSRLVKVGWLKAYKTQAGFDAASSAHALMRQLGVNCTDLNATQIKQLEPALGENFPRAVFHSDCHVVGDPYTYVRELADPLLKAGIRCRTTEVRSVEVRNGRVVGVNTDRETIATDALVLAAGAWSGHLAKSLGCRPPLDTERGYHMMLDTSRCDIRLQRPVYWDEKSIVISPMGEHVRVTSSVEFAGLDAAPNYDLVLRHLDDVEQLLPGSKLVPNSAWLGFRPSMPDSLPVIGPVPGVGNAFLAFGHGHLGLTLGPVTGEIIGAMLDGEAASLPIEPFSASRFSNRS